MMIASYRMLCSTIRAAGDEAMSKEPSRMLAKRFPGVDLMARDPNVHWWLLSLMTGGLGLPPSPRQLASANRAQSGLVSFPINAR